MHTPSARSPALGTAQGRLERPAGTGMATYAERIGGPQGRRGFGEVVLLRGAARPGGRAQAPWVRWARMAQARALGAR